MKKFIAEDSFWQLFPQAELAVAVISDIKNSDDIYDSHPEIKVNLKEANAEAEKFITSDQLSKCPAVAVWRDAFQLFKKKKGNRASIEALLNRIEKGKGVGPINPLVDIYNAVSLSYGLPCGGEDADTFKGNLRLAITTGGDSFMALGDEENDPSLEGELCYLDDEGAVCRCWNWRDGVRTMLTEKTTKAFLILESVDPSRHDDLAEAIEVLAKNAVKYLGGKVTSKGILNKENREIQIG